MPAARDLPCVSADTRVAGNCSGGEVDGDPRTREGIVVVHGIVKSATTIEKVVSAATFKLASSRTYTRALAVLDG